MSDVSIHRCLTSPNGTFGLLSVDGEPLCVTLEPPWRANEIEHSCIPEGEYQAAKIKSPKFGSTYEIQQVPDRTDILFHIGNTVADTHGCILIGQMFGRLTSGQVGILSSRISFVKFISALSGVRAFRVSFRDCF